MVLMLSYNEERFFFHKEWYIICIKTDFEVYGWCLNTFLILMFWCTVACTQLSFVAMNSFIRIVHLELPLSCLSFSFVTDDSWLVRVLVVFCSVLFSLVSICSWLNSNFLHSVWNSIHKTSTSAILVHNLFSMDIKSRKMFLLSCQCPWALRS